MKILFVAAGSFPGNASFIRPAALGGELLRLGHDPVYCLTEAPGTRQLLEQYGVPNRCVWAASRSPLDFARACSEFEGVDFVHLINANLAGEVVALRLRRRGARIISDWDEWLSTVPRGPLAQSKYRAMEWIARRISSGFVFSSTFLQNEYRKYIPGIPTTYIPYGFNPSGAISPGLADKVLRPGRRYALYLGSLSDSYREDLRELVLLAQCCRDLDLDLVVAGDGSERPWVEAEVGKHLPDGRAVFTGQLTLPVLDGLVPAESIRLSFLPLKDTPQNRSRCPNKVFHYIRGGKPVVTNRVGEPANLLGDQGHYYQYGDRTSMAAAVTQALEHRVVYPVDQFTWAGRAAAYVRFLEENFR